MIDLIEKVQTLRLEPGDMLVLTMKEAVTPDQAEEVQSSFHQWFPQNKLLILEEGMSLQHVTGQNTE